ncbi:spore germination protein [Psychrobacillus sp.]|uniref:spore germination protein n=1 Tax=Psychrobacillus sp. TaxID=1871623 RepID=UPI0028BD9E10|nr:spore germination protein [Psychrobacillus sp.]
MVSYKEIVESLENEFSQAFDFIAKELVWNEEHVILCYYSTMIDTAVVMEQLQTIQRKFEAGEAEYGQTAFSEEMTFTIKQFRESICNGETVIVFPKTDKMIRILLPKIASREPSSPENEYVVRGGHDGFVENLDVNINLIRKKLKSPDLKIEKHTIGAKSNTTVSIIYLTTKVDNEALKVLKARLDRIEAEMIYSSGQLEDYLEDVIWSPFPQFLNTERPDRAVANLVDGKIIIFSDSDPTALIGPITLFTFYESPDDFNGRVLVGSFYRLVRLASFFTAIFLPAFYIAVVSFHFEIMPIDLGEQVKSSVANIPFRPIFEALLLELLIELIREASIRLPSPIGQTIGVVGGLVIGDAIVAAGLASNLMVIVVASTALASFVVPSVEMNTTVRLLRFPFMVLASMFGFFGIVIGSMLLFIHLLNLQSLNRPYLSPIIPFEPTKIKSIFFRLPYYKQVPQQRNFYLFSKKGKKKHD